MKSEVIIDSILSEVDVQSVLSEVEEDYRVSPYRMTDEHDLREVTDNSLREIE